MFRFFLFTIVLFHITSCNKKSKNSREVHPPSSGNLNCEAEDHFFDGDGDGFGSGEAKLGCPGDENLESWSRQGEDTNDNDANLFPGASCDGLESGESIYVLGYRSSTSQADEACESERQRLSCKDGMLSRTGSFTHTSCNGAPFSPTYVGISFTGGEAGVGTLLSCTHTEVEDSDSMGEISYSLAWFKDGIHISGDKDYIVTSEDMGSNLNCEVIAIDSQGLESDLKSSEHLYIKNHCDNASTNNYDWSTEIGRADSANSPLLICNAEQFVDFATKCGYSEGSSDNETSCSSHIELANDIDLGDTSFGAEISIGYNVSFSGSIEGNNHTVSGYTIHSSQDWQHHAIFGALIAASIKNIGFETKFTRGNVTGMHGSFVNYCGTGSQLENLSLEIDIEANYAGAAFATDWNCDVDGLKMNARIDYSIADTVSDDEYIFPVGLIMFANGGSVKNADIDIISH